MTLSSRVLATERMDAGCVDFAEYRRCLRDLTRVNRLTLTHRDCRNEDGTRDDRTLGRMATAPRYERTQP